MTDRPSVFQTVQVGLESGAGSTPANKRLQALSIRPKPAVEVETFTPSGMKYPTLTALGKDWTAASLEGQPTYSEIIYPLASLFGHTSGSGAAAGSAGAYSWTFTTNEDAADTPRKFSVEQGDANIAAQFVNAVVTGVTLDFSRSKISMSGDMIGRKFTTGITMTGSPSSIDLVPVLPSQVSVYLDETGAELGDTQLDRALSVSWGLTGKYTPFWVVDATEDSYVATLDAAPTLGGKLRVQADSTGVGFLANLRAGDTRFLRIEATGALIGDSEYYSLTIDTAIKFTNVSELSDSDGVFAVDYDYIGVYDATWDATTQIVVQNELATL